jgi:isoquinoline 1-oxidoreductase beta subunit
VIAWQTRVASPSIASRMNPANVRDGVDLQMVSCFVDAPYAVPNVLVEYAMRNTHVPVGFWRAVAHSQNPFPRECFVDELAHAAGRDPYAFRRAMIEAQAGVTARRDLGVLDAVARAAQWDRPLPSGVFRGIAVQDAYGSHAAAVVELSMPRPDRIKVLRVVLAVDPGHVVNSDAARAQIEGCVAFGLSAAYFGENTVRDGRIVERNFNDYPLLGLADMPRVEAVLVPSGGFWGGMGEPPMAPLAPALVNALFAATGRRIRSLPLRAHGFALA